MLLKRKKKQKPQPVTSLSFFSPLLEQIWTEPEVLKLVHVTGSYQLYSSTVPQRTVYLPLALKGSDERLRSNPFCDDHVSLWLQMEIFPFPSSLTSSLSKARNLNLPILQTGERLKQSNNNFSSWCIVLRQRIPVRQRKKKPTEKELPFGIKVVYSASVPQINCTARQPLSNLWFCPPTRYSWQEMAHGSDSLLWIFLRLLKCKVRRVMRSEWPTALQKIRYWSLTRSFNHSFPKEKMPEYRCHGNQKKRYGDPEPKPHFRLGIETQRICSWFKTLLGNTSQTVYYTTASIFSVEAESVLYRQNKNIYFRAQDE